MKDSGSTTKNLISSVTQNLMRNQQNAATKNPVQGKHNQPTSSSFTKNDKELVERIALLGMKGLFIIDDRRDFWLEYEEGLRAARERRDQRIAEQRRKQDWYDSYAQSGDRLHRRAPQRVR